MNEPTNSQSGQGLTYKKNTTPSPMSRIDELFARLRAAKKKALMPFITAGDPDLEFTAAVLT